MLGKYLFLGIVIGANNFAVALTLGANNHFDKKFRILLIFGLFEFTVPLIGSALGQQFSNWLQSNLNWLPPFLLCLIGFLSLYGLVKEGSEKSYLDKAMSIKGLIILAMGLSVDNLALGFSLGALAFKPILLASVIGVCSVTFSYVGLYLGKKGHTHLGKISQILFAFTLIGLAFFL